MAYRSSAMASATSALVLSATPAGVQANDYLTGMLIADVPPAGNTTASPTGWNAAVNNDMTIDSQKVGYADKDAATGSDSFQWSNSPTNGNLALINCAHSGRDNASPRSATPVFTKLDTSNATPISASFTGITALTGDDLILFMGTDQTADDGRWTFSTISGFTERQDGVNVDWVSGIALDTQDNVSAGATGSLASTITRDSGTGNAGYFGVIFAAKAAAASSLLKKMRRYL